MVDPEAMGVAMAKEACLQEKGEGKTKDKRRRATDTDREVTTPTGMATVATATMTCDEQDGDMPTQGATSTTRGPCPREPGREKGNK